MTTELTLTHTRQGDAQMASWKPNHLSGTHYVFVHDDGGVTLELRWPHRPSDRLSYMREEWAALVALVDEARNHPTRGPAEGDAR